MTHPLTPREQYEQAKRDFNNLRDDGTLTPREKSQPLGCFCDEADCPSCSCVNPALASGSGDHAELARLADMADWMADGDPGANGSVLLSASVASEHAADLRALLAENAALREERDQIRALHNRATDRSRHWEIASINADNRATEAERKLAEADRLLERIANDPTWDGPSSARLYFLSKEAERG